MAKADSVHSTPPTNTPIDPSRRRFLSQAAGIAAGGTVLALTMIEPAPAAATSANPDAEIVAAGKAFEPLLSRYLDAQFVWARLVRETGDERDAKFPDDDFDVGSPKWIFHSEAAKRNGCTEAAAHLSAIWQEMEPLSDLIREAAAETIEGLRAKTLVAIWDCQPVCATHEGGFEFSDQRSHWSLFHAAVAVTGLSEMMVSAIDIRLQVDAGIPQDGET
jgi:hypothetical protein